MSQAKKKPNKKTAVKQTVVKKTAMRRTIRGGRPYFFADPAVDKVLNMVVTLGSEVWALRERLIAMESLQIKKMVFKVGEIDSFEFPPAQEAALAVDRKEFIENLFHIMPEQVESARVQAAKAKRKA